MAAENPHESAARLRKVLAICLLVPAGANEAENARAAAHLAAMPRADRDLIAAAAGCRHPPSDETWRQVVEAVRARPVTNDGALLGRVFGGAA